MADQVAAPTADTPAPTTVMVVARDDVYGNDFTAALSAELTARGITVTTLSYPALRVQFPDEGAAVTTTNADKTVLVSYEEAPQLVSSIVNAGYPVDRIVGLDGMLVPRLAEQTFPSDANQANGLTVYGATGNRALIDRLQQVPASQDQISFGAQMYDCVITLALASIAAGSVEPAAIAAQVGPVTNQGWPCSTFAHCVEMLAAGEDIHYTGATGGLQIDASGDVTTERITTARVIDGQLQPVSSQEIDLTTIRQHELFISAVFVAQLQQALRVLGYYDGPVTGVYDDATTAAVAALQRDLGLPETGVYDEATDAAVREKLGGAVSTLGTSTAQLQQALTDLGYYSGPIDGRFSAATVAAVKAFQTDLGVPATGIPDVATMTAIHQRGLEQGATSATTTTTAAPKTTTVAPTRRADRGADTGADRAGTNAHRGRHHDHDHPAGDDDHHHHRRAGARQRVRQAERQRSVQHPDRLRQPAPLPERPRPVAAHAVRARLMPRSMPIPASSPSCRTTSPRSTICCATWPCPASSGPTSCRPAT